MNKFVVFLVKIARVMCRPFFPVQIFGDRKIENKKRLLVGNHLSGWDPVIFTMWMKNIMSFVYKAEFRKNLFLRWVFDGLGCVPVHRGEVDINASKSILRLLKEDKSVCLFPEGTRNPEVDCLQPFHTGAALFAIKTRSPIRPFYIWDKTKAFRKNYISIGEEFTLEQFYDRPLDKQTLEEATKVIRDKVDELRLDLNARLEARGVRRRTASRADMQKNNAYNADHKPLSDGLAHSDDGLADGEDGNK